MKDPTGLFATPGPGLVQFANCFSLHTAAFGNSVMPAKAAVDRCKEGFSKDMWNHSFFNFNGNLPTTAHDLFGWYLFEHGNKTRLDFGADASLTKELLKALSIHRLRSEYYSKGDTPEEPGQYYFNRRSLPVVASVKIHNNHCKTHYFFRTSDIAMWKGATIYQTNSDSSSP